MQGPSVAATTAQRLRAEALKGNATRVWGDRLKALDRCLDSIREDEGSVELVDEASASTSASASASKAPAASESADAGPEALAAFSAWLAAEGVDVGAVGLARVEALDCNGVVCSRALAAGEEAFAVPRKLMLTVEQVVERGEEDMLSRMCRKDPLLRAMPMMILAMVLVEEHHKGAASFYKPYLDVLPRKFPTLPLMWSTAQLDALEGTDAGTEALSRCFDCILGYCHLKPLFMEALPQISFARFRWAMAVAMTRQNPLPTKAEPAVSSLALIPLFDMCNHGPGAITSGYEPEGDCLRCAAVRDCEAGEEFRIFYGARTNTNFLVYSGFVLPPGQNAGDVVRGALDLVPDDLLPLKLGLLDKTRISLGDMPLRLAPDGEAMQLSRLAVASKEDLALILRAQQAAGSYARFERVSDDNEARAVEHLREAIQLRADEVIATRAKLSERTPPAPGSGVELAIDMAKMLLDGQAHVLLASLASSSSSSSDPGGPDPTASTGASATKA